MADSVLSNIVSKTKNKTNKNKTNKNRRNGKNHRNANKKRNNNNVLKCVICLENLFNNVNITALTCCNQLVHANCYDRAMLTRPNKCPYCKSNTPLHSSYEYR